MTEERDTRRRPQINPLTIAGGVALLAAVFGATAGMLLYGADMAPNLAAEATGVCLEIGLAALVVDRLVSRHQQRRWNFAYDALAQRVSETFVDVMRLAHLSASPEALKANIDSYDRFVRLGERHHADLRSHIESTAAVLDTRTHETYRRVERRLSWCLEQLQHAPSPTRNQLPLRSILIETAGLAFALITDNGKRHTHELTTARASLDQATAELPDLPAGAIQIRLHAQSILLAATPRNGAALSSIGQDIDNDYSIPYFMIDYLLLVPLR